MWLNAAVPAPPEAMTGSRELTAKGMQAAYIVAHRMLRAYWFVRRPSTWGSLLAVWHDGELLLVKNSYRRHWTLPGGYIQKGETPVQAACRELGEEVGAHIPPELVRQTFTAVREFEFRKDKVTISEVTLDTRPELRIDQREVVWAGFLSPAEILARPIVPHLRDYLACHPSGRA